MMILKQAEQFPERIARSNSLMVPTEHLTPHYTLDYSGEIGSEGYPTLDDIKQNGIRDPIEMETDGRLGRIRDGNHRVAIANMLGISHVPVTFTKQPTSYMKLYRRQIPLHDSIQQHLAAHPEDMVGHR